MHKLKKTQNHPVSGYRVSNLFTGGNDLSMDDEIRRDIQIADQIDLTVSFIKFQGLRLLYEELECRTYGSDVSREWLSGAVCYFA